MTISGLLYSFLFCQASFKYIKLCLKYDNRWPAFFFYFFTGIFSIQCCQHLCSQKLPATPFSHFLEYSTGKKRKILLNKRMWYKKPGTPLTFGPSKCSNVMWEAHKRVFQSLQTRGHLLGGENTQVYSTAL